MPLSRIQKHGRELVSTEKLALLQLLCCALIVVSDEMMLKYTFSGFHFYCVVTGLWLRREGTANTPDIYYCFSG